jgi:RNA polymerase sigma-70 factor (ECF subfamily)
VRELLATLPPDYRAAVILRYWHELTYEEVAETLDATVPAIKSRLFRARQMMAQAATQTEAVPTRNNSVFWGGGDTSLLTNTIAR